MKQQELKCNKKLSLNYQSSNKHLRAHHYIDSGTKIFWCRKANQDNIKGKFQYNLYKGKIGEMAQMGKIKKILNERRYKNSIQIGIDAHSIKTPKERKQFEAKEQQNMFYRLNKFPLSPIKTQKKVNISKNTEDQQAFHVTATKLPDLSSLNINKIRHKSLNKSIRQSNSRRQNDSQSKTHSNLQQRESLSIKKLTQINISLDADREYHKILSIQRNSQDKNMNKFQIEFGKFASLEIRKKSKTKRIRKHQQNYHAQTEETFKQQKKDRNIYANLQGPSIKPIQPLLKQNKKKIKINDLRICCQGQSSKTRNKKIGWKEKNYEIEGWTNQNLVDEAEDIS